MASSAILCSSSTDTAGASSGSRARRRWGASTPSASNVSPESLQDQECRPTRRWDNSIRHVNSENAGDDGYPAEVNEPHTALGIIVADAALLGGKPPASMLAAASAATAKRRQALSQGGFKRLGVQLAEELFRPRAVALSHESRCDVSSLGQTSTVVTTQKLSRDFEKIADGNAVYWPECLCGADDHSVFHALYQELAPWKMSPYKRSRHPACVEETRLLASPMYRHVVTELREVFDIKVGYSIVNLYADGDDWTEYHRDNFRAEGNRMTSSSAEEAPAPHNVTVGASFGDSRELRFKHLETGLEFSFPQGNGDVFAFTEPVNSAFQHCIPKKIPAATARPRISVILWGRTESPGILHNVCS